MVVLVCNLLSIILLLIAQVVVVEVLSQVELPEVVELAAVVLVV
jgi:hypothetical protein